MYKLIKKRDLIKVLIRSFLIEASWNFERMQNVGFVYALAPVAHKLCFKKEEKVEFLKRHLKFFNTHPAMAPLILGVVVNMEEKSKINGSMNLKDIENIKNSMMGPLAAIGDNIFWEYLRPFSALIGVSIVLLSKGNYRLAFLGPLISLIVYNSFGLFIRYKGIINGYEKGTEVVTYLQKFDFPTLGKKLSLSSALILGTTLAVFPFEYLNLFRLTFLNNILFVTLTFLFVLSLKIKISTTTLFYSIIVSSIIFRYIFKG